MWWKPGGDPGGLVLGPKSMKKHGFSILFGAGASKIGKIENRPLLSTRVTSYCVQQRGGGQFGGVSGLQSAWIQLRSHRRYCIRLGGTLVLQLGNQTRPGCAIGKTCRIKGRFLTLFVPFKMGTPHIKSKDLPTGVHMSLQKFRVDTRVCATLQ